MFRDILQRPPAGQTFGQTITGGLEGRAVDARAVDARALATQIPSAGAQRPLKLAQRRIPRPGLPHAPRPATNAARSPASARRNAAPAPEGERGGLDRRPKGRRRIREDGPKVSELDEPVKHEYTAAELEYMAQKRAEAAKVQSSDVYIPENMLESLAGWGPRIPVTDWGKGEMIEGRLSRLAPAGERAQTRLQDLAEALVRGDLVRFRTEDEKDAAVKLAHHMAQRRAELKSERTGELAEPEPPEYEPLGEAEKRKALDLEGLLQGSYEGPRDVPKGQENLKEALSCVRRNGTYNKTDEVALAKKLDALTARPAALGGRKPVV
jgi:hypothetical protein